MSKISSIIQGWKNDWLYKRGKIPEPIKELFDDRLKTCRSNECGQLIGFVCGACGCPIKKKAKSLGETCPENMWNPAYYQAMGEDEPLFMLFNEVPQGLQQQLTTYLVNMPDKLWANEYLKRFKAVHQSLDGVKVQANHWEEFLKELEKQL